MKYNKHWHLGLAAGGWSLAIIMATAYMTGNAGMVYAADSELVIEEIGETEAAIVENENSLSEEVLFLDEETEATKWNETEGAEDEMSADQTDEELLLSVEEMSAADLQVEAAADSQGTVADSGSCGSTAVWKLYSDGTLEVSGTGEVSCGGIGSCLPSYVEPVVKKIIINEGITRIDDEAFWECSNLTDVSIAESVTSIGAQAFAFTSITSITIPAGVTEIGDGAFTSDNLSGIWVDSNNPCYTSIDGVLFTKDRKTLLQYPGGKGGTYEIPEGTTQIGELAFDELKVPDSVIIPSSVTYIGEMAFCGMMTNLKSVYFKGDAPEFCLSLGNIRTFHYTTTMIYYPSENDTWTDRLLLELTLDSTNSTTCEEWDVPGVQKEISRCTVTLSEDSFTYDGKEKKPTVTVQKGTVTLTEGVDYTVSYSNHIKAGTATVFVTGKGNYTGTVTSDFTIQKAGNCIQASDINRSANPSKSQTFSIGAKASGGKLTYQSDNSKIKVNSAGKVTVAKNYAGKASITITASDHNYETAKKVITVTVKPIANTITVSNVTKTCAGKSQMFALGVKRKGNGKISYSSNSKSVTVNRTGKVTIAGQFIGKATITVEVAASGGYKSASTKVTVTVNPAKTTLSGVSNTKGKKMTVKWKKDSAVTGYQLQYSTDKNFKTGVQKVTVKKTGTTSYVISKLTKGKTYYVRIRSYKTVSEINYYSEWSSAKQVKISK